MTYSRFSLPVDRTLDSQSPNVHLFFVSDSLISDGSGRIGEIEAGIDGSRTEIRTDSFSFRCKLLILKALRVRVRYIPYTLSPDRLENSPESPTRSRQPARARMKRRICVPHAEKFPPRQRGGLEP